MPAMPFITLAVIPIVILDIWIELYHRIAFPLYKIPIVKRKEYIKIDRHKLPYLSWLQKYYCVFCGYANGIVKYWVEIFAETEAFWCGIKHENSDTFKDPKHHAEFVPFGDKEAYEEEYVSKKHGFLF